MFLKVTLHSNGACIFMHMAACIHVNCVGVCMCMRGHIWICVPAYLMCGSVHVYIHACMHLCIHAYEHLYTHV